MDKFFNFDRAVQLLMLGITIFGAYYLWIDHHKDADPLAVVGGVMTPWWAYCLVALGLVALVSQWVRWWVARSPQPDFSGKKPLTQVQNQNFANGPVPLDGYHYLNCTFTNVTLVYEGNEPFQLSNFQLRAASPGDAITLLSHNPAVRQTMDLLGLMVNVSDRNAPIQTGSNTIPRRT